MPDWIELRSDTFTLPTPAMRRAIADAEVGNDMVGEDPTVNRLEAMFCERLGKEAAVFASSGTQSNQMAVWSHCRPGDELLIEGSGHIAHWEAGAPAALSGVTCRGIKGAGGILDVSDLEGALGHGDYHEALTTLLCLENTTNMGGGRVWPLEQLHRVAEWGHRKGLAVHLDGARLFNAVVASGVDAAEICRPFDTVSVCLSKGLGCPMGSVLAGPAAVIDRARRARKVFGGSLRQAGMMAAAAVYALTHHVDRLAEDHANAARMAERLAVVPGLTVRPDEVESNMVFITTEGPAAGLAAALRERGVRLFDVGPHRLRAVTHLDVSAEDVDRAAGAFESVVG